MAIYLGNTLLTGPSGGGGDATLSADQTFTGANTFSDTTIFNSTSNNGSIRVDSITGVLSEDTNIAIGFSSMVFEVADDSYISLSSLGSFKSFRINESRNDINFSVRGITNDAINYDAGTDTLTSTAANIGGNLPPAVPTVDGDYKLVVSSGTVTWQTI